MRGRTRGAFAVFCGMLAGACLTAAACSSEKFGTSADAGGGDAFATDAATSDGAALDGAPLTCPDADLGFDKENCGRCGRSCGGAQCVEHVCLPVKLADIPGPEGLWLVGSEIYFTAWDNGGGLFHFDRAKNAPELLVPQAGAWDLTGTSDLLEWTNWSGSTEGGGVYVYTFANRQSHMLFASGSPRDVWRDGEGIYFVDDFEQGISAALDSSPSTKYSIVPSGSVTLAGPSTDQNYAYWASTTDHAIFAAPKRGNGQVRKAVDVPGVPSWTLVDGNFLYVAYSTTGDPNACGAGAIARGTLRNDGTVDPLQTIAPDQRCPTALTAHGDWILWTEDTANGAVRRFGKTAGNVETIIDKRGRPFRVRVDDQFAYFLEFTTRQLWQVALP